jgi:phage shock protein A
MNRDFPLAPTFFGDKEKKVKRLEKREAKLVKKGNKAVDEGRDKKADRVFKRAANVEDRLIRLSGK